MKTDNDTLTTEQYKLLEELENMAEEDIDTVDIPEELEVKNPRRGA